MKMEQKILVCVGIFLTLTIAVGTANATVTVDSLTKLTDNPYTDNVPDWSPDDTKIIYVDHASNWWTDSRIVEMNSDGYGKVEVIPETAWFARYSPDGTKIAYASYPSDGSLSLKDLNSGSVELLVSGEGIYEGVYPNWSPDGKKIVYSRYVRGSPHGPGQIWIYDLESKTNTKISTDDTIDERYPAWSPDGKYISYVKDGKDIWIMNPDDTGKTPITSTPDYDKAVHSWSPDSSKIVFASNYYGNNDLFIINIADKAETRLTTDTSNDGNPDWSHGGNKIAFESDRSGNYDIWVMTLDEHDEPNPVEKYALVVGADTGGLNGAEYSAEEMYRFLTACGYDSVLLLGDGTSSAADNSATFCHIKSELDDLNEKIDSNDKVIFYFAGHGYQTLDHTYQIIPEDEIAMNVFTINTGLDSAKNLVAIFDCCLSGGFNSAMEYHPDGKVILMSCSSEENSYSHTYYKGVWPSRMIFTTELIDAFIQDFSLDGFISIEDSFQVAKYATSYNVNYYWNFDQNPQIEDNYPSEDDNDIDFYLYENQKSIVGFVECPVNIHAYDSQGRHSGINEFDEIEEYIPNSYYTGSESEPEQIIIFNQSENIVYVIDSFDEGTFNFTLKQRTAGSLVEVEYLNVPTEKSTTTSVNVVSENKEFLMQIDVDGDGTVDETKEPDSITINGEPVNRPPRIDSLDVLQTEPVEVGTEIDLSITFSDPDLDDTHDCIIDWGDGTITEPFSVTSPLTDSYIYSAPGVYSIKVTIEDNDGLIDTEEYHYIVVYDSTGGFVTGGGWINSPAGAVPDTTLAGKATFTLESKYKKGATLPTDNTNFQFKTANLKFKSASCDWLVISGAQAKYKGTGTINGAGEYGFMLSAVDGAIKGDNIDKFRIKIWDKVSGEIVYDNQLDAPEDAEPTTAIGGGSIVIHKAK